MEVIAPFAFQVLVSVICVVTYGTYQAPSHTESETVVCDDLLSEWVYIINLTFGGGGGETHFAQIKTLGPLS